MECGAAVSAGLRRGILFAGKPRLALAHGHWLCVHGVCGLFGSRNHQRLVGRKLLSYRIARRTRTILCIHWFSLDVNPASNLLRRNVQATTDSDIFRVHPYDSLVRRTDGLRFHGSFHRPARKLHSNLLGLHVERGNWITDGSLHDLALALWSKSAGLEAATGRAIGVMGDRLRLEAYTLTFI